MHGVRGAGMIATAAVGAAAVVAALAWMALGGGAHRARGSGGLLADGIAALVVAAAWAGWRAWRDRRAGAAPAGAPEPPLLDRAGAVAYPAVFAAFAVIAALTPAIGLDAATGAAIAGIVWVLMAWLAMRGRALVRRIAPEPTGLPEAMAPERPGDASTRQYLAPAGESRTARSWRLSRTAFALLRGDRAMLVLALLGAAFTIAATLAIFALAGWLRDPGREGHLLVYYAIFSWPMTFVATFLNVALAAAADARLDGRRLTVRAALGVAVGRLGPIAGWSLLATGVGILLQQLAERVPVGGRVAGWLLGVAWGLVTFFAIPLLALEGCSPTGTVRRSSRLIRARWGEGVGGTVLIGAWAMPLLAIAGGLIGVGAGAHGQARVTVIAIGLGLLVAAIALTTAARQVFAVALYRYATDGTAAGGFAEPDLRAPFSARRRLTGR
jgi:Family of unknown function (DUF6159)